MSERIDGVSHDNKKLPIKIHGVSAVEPMRELIDEFMPPEDYELVEDDGFFFDDCLHVNSVHASDKDGIKREIFDKLRALTGIKPDWGILTGVRPVKLAGELIEKTKSRVDAKKILLDEYKLSEV